MKYDVIVIGGGLSGLMAGITAAARGKKTLLLEKHATVGGLAAGFTRKGYYFDAGMSRAMGYSIRGSLKELGILETADLKPQPAIWNIAGCWIEYSSLERLFHGLAELFHEEKGPILELYEREVKPAEAMLAPLFSDMSAMSAPQKILHGFRLLRAVLALSISRSTKEMEGDVLGRYLDPGGRARRFLVEKEDEIDYRGEMNFLTKVGKWHSQIHNVYPSTGFQGIAEAMRARLVAYDGEVRTCTMVQKIIIQDHKAAGVEIEAHGEKETLYAENVICCMDINKAFRQLIGTHYLDPAFLSRLEKSKLSLAIPILYLGVNVPPERVKAHFKGHEEVYFYPVLEPGPEEAAFFRDHPMIIHSSCFHNPAHAPAGKTNLQVYLSCPPAGWMGHWGLKDGMRTDRYREIKAIATGHILGVLGDLIPELRDSTRIEVCELGTPFTLERYTGNTDGSCLGFRMDADFLNSKQFGKYFDHYDGIANLYFAGQQTGYPGGLINAFGSGKQAGKLV